MEKGLPSVGTWQQISSSSISEILGNSGYDWVALDLEHGSISSSVKYLICFALLK